MKRFLLALGVILAASGMERAMADEICPALTKLLTDPPAGFVALRGEKTSTVWPNWDAKPFVPGAVCVLRGDESTPQQELRCTMNEKATADATKAWYQSTGAAIDACLPKLPHGSGFSRKAEVSKSADGFQGVTTVWVYDGKADRIEIELTNDVESGAAGNTLAVRYLKR